VLLKVTYFLLDAELQQLLQKATNPTPETGGRRAPTCRKCGAPRKGHKRGECQVSIT